MGKSQVANHKSKIPSAVVLLSGGVDSTTLLYYVKSRLGVEDVYALSVLYGQKHSRELEMARWQAEKAGVLEHKVIELPLFADITSGSSALTDPDIAVPELGQIDESELDQPVTYVPNRNMVLLSLAAAYAEARGVTDLFYGAQAQDEYGYWDCTVDFISKINDVLKLNRRDTVEVRAPFAEMSKAEVVRLGLELGVDYDHTWTCYRGGREPCGECPSCVERTAAFKKA